MTSFLPTPEPIVIRPFSESLPMALLQAREAAMRLFRPLLADFDLTEQQWRVLRALTAVGEVEAGVLAEQTFLLSPSLSRILTNLNQRGLIHRRTHPADQRRSLIKLSERGRDLVRRVAPESESAYSMIEADFGAERLDRLLSELHHLAQLVPGSRRKP